MSFSTGQDGVAIQFSAEVSQLESGLKTAVAGSQAATAEFRELGSGSREGASGLDFLVEKLKDHKAEMRAESGMTRVLARDLAGLGLDAKGAGGEIAHLLASFAIGGGIGAAMGAVKLIAGEFAKVEKEEKAAEDAAAAWHAAMQKDHDKEMKELQELEDKLAGFGAATKNSRALQLTMVDIDTVESQLDGLRESRDKLKREGEEQGFIIPTTKLDQEIEHAEAQLADLQRHAADLFKKGDTIGAIDTSAQLAAQSKLEAAKADAAAKAHQKEIDDAAKTAAAAGAAARSAAEKDLATESELKQKWALKDASAEEKVDLELQADLSKVSLLSEDTRVQLTQAAETRKEQIREKARWAEIDAASQAWRDEQATQERALQKMEQTVTKYLRPMTHAVEQAFAGLIEGNMDLAKVWDTLWKGMVQTVINSLVQMAEQELVEAIAKKILGQTTALAQVGASGAAGGAAAAAAAAPFFWWNPEAAVAIGVAMDGAISGAFGGLALASFDVGTPYVPYDQVAMIHKGERIITAADNAKGAGGGGDTHVHVSGVIDGNHLMRVVRSREFRHAMHEAQRNRET